MERKDFGICKQCGQRIEEFEYAIEGLEYWYCQACYNLYFPAYEPEPPQSDRDLFKESYVVGDTSYKFLKEHLYRKPRLYEPSFRLLRGYLVFFQNFNTFKEMLKFLRHQGKPIREQVIADLTNLDKKQRWLRPQIMEMLLFIRWRDIVRKYGTGVNFADGYFELLLELETTDRRHRWTRIKNSDC